MSQTTVINRDPIVTILMGVRDGADHLQAQLDSIAAQTHKNWRLVCSDDRSTDSSLKILQNFARLRPGQVVLLKGPGTGFSNNYMSLIRTIPKQPVYVSFADQDDIWLPDKLQRGIECLGKAGPSPTLYCGRQTYWFPQTGRKTASMRMNRPFTLRNALIENVAPGNTIMLNPAAANLAQQAALCTDQIFAHDWWLYLLMTATGGHVHFDNGRPTLLYRQHRGNVIGAGKGLLPQVRRKIGVLRGHFSQRIDGNLTALLSINDLLTPQARDICQNFTQARRASGLARLAALHRIAPYRQRRADTLGFWGAASLGRV